MNNIDEAAKALKEGKFVLMHDASGRENETDMVVAGEKITPEHIARMRTDGGGLICVAMGMSIAERLELAFMADIYRKAAASFPVLAHLKADDIPYDEKSSFSITINHRKTFTGITDVDRALTIREFAKLADKPNAEDFGRNFRTPGHVHLLISSGLENREGHTELSVALMELAKLKPLAVICEMMDSETHKSLSPGKAGEYAVRNGLVFLETDEVKKTYLGGKR
ncbi:MAG: 3,4-dihydroxy-2-butanone-4-phosphate synthase [Candidatus Altiarchaeota archaeon]|nr:3,4-dihydroxy-2-butanone-4-phosphate synthase [Candidatus Altiarchaeota archaeon]